MGNSAMTAIAYPAPRPPPSKGSRKPLVAAILIVIIVVVALVGVYFVTNGFSSGSNTPSPSPTETPAPSPTPPPTRVLLQTSMGNITIKLRDDKPITSGNFLNLTQHGVYDGVILHRVIANFMIQGGDPTGTGFGDPSIATIPDEIGSNNRNVRGTIAMAKTAQPNSASSQFFINVVDNGLNPDFDSTYTVFGNVVEGMDVVDAISKVATDRNDRPLQNVTIIKAEALP